MDSAYARSVGSRPQKSEAKYNPPWKRVLLRYLRASRLKTKRGTGLWTLYRRMGWNDSLAYWKTRSARELRPTELAQMARILRTPIGPFLEAVVRETGIPPVGESGTPIRKTSRRKRSQHCSICHARDHNRLTCLSPHAGARAAIEMHVATLAPARGTRRRLASRYRERMKRNA